MYLSVNLFSQGTSYFTYDDLWGLKRIGGIELSPDGKTIAFTQSVYSMDLNKGNSDIYLVDINGKHLRPFKTVPKVKQIQNLAPMERK
jgi:dipeptidyl aminopeptidase/acylaminoacyl peptidase